MEHLDPLVQAIDAEVAAMTASQILVGCPRNWTGRGKVKAAGEKLEEAARRIVAARFIDDGEKETKLQLQAATKAFTASRREWRKAKASTERKPTARKNKKKRASISSAAFWGGR